MYNNYYSIYVIGHGRISLVTCNNDDVLKIIKKDYLKKLDHYQVKALCYNPNDIALDIVAKFKLDRDHDFLDALCDNTNPKVINIFALYADKISNDQWNRLYFNIKRNLKIIDLVAINLDIISKLNLDNDCLNDLCHSDNSKTIDILSLYVDRLTKN